MEFEVQLRRYNLGHHLSNCTELLDHLRPCVLVPGLVMSRSLGRLALVLVVCPSSPLHRGTPSHKFAPVEGTGMAPGSLETLISCDSSPSRTARGHSCTPPCAQKHTLTQRGKPTMHTRTLVRTHLMPTPANIATVHTCANHLCLSTSERSRMPGGQAPQPAVGSQ